MNFSVNASFWVISFRHSLLLFCCFVVLSVLCVCVYAFVMNVVNNSCWLHWSDWGKLAVILRLSEAGTYHCRKGLLLTITFCLSLARYLCAYLIVSCVIWLFAFDLQCSLSLHLSHVAGMLITTCIELHKVLFLALSVTFYGRPVE